MPHGKIEPNSRQISSPTGEIQTGESLPRNKAELGAGAGDDPKRADARCESSRLLYPNRNAKAKKSLAYPTCRIEFTNSVLLGKNVLKNKFKSKY